MTGYRLNIAALNAICDRLEGVGGHRRIIAALNEWCMLAGGAGGHDTSVSALNAIAVRLGGTGGHLFNIGALNEIAVRLGGGGDHRMHVDALAQIVQRLGGEPGAPVLTEAPTIAGTPRVGQTLTAATDGAWTGSPSLARNWQRDGVDIGGEAGVVYAVTEADDGRAIRLRVTASNAGGSATAYSAPASVSYAAPVGSPAPGAFGVELGAGSHAFDARPLFTVAGDADLSGCSFALKAGGTSVLAGGFTDGQFAAGGAGISIDPGTGIVTDDGTGEAVAGGTMTVACTNSGGTGTADVAYHAEQPAATLAYVGAVYSANPATTAQVGPGTQAGDRVVATFGRSGSIAAFGGQVSDLGSGAGASRVGQFVAAGPGDSFPIPAGSHGAASSFRGAGPVTEVRFASGTGQSPSFPAAPVVVPGSLVLLMAHRAATGGVGGLANLPAGFSVAAYSAGSRTFTLLSDAPRSSFAGATVTFSAASATWATAVVVVPPA